MPISKLNCSEGNSLMVSLFGVNFENLNNKSFVEVLTTSLDLQKSIHLIAVSTLVETKKSVELAKLINNGIAVCDSKILERVIRIFYPRFSRVRGTDFFRNFVLLDDGKNRHFLLGGTDEELLKLKVKMKESNPKIVVVGTFAPSFSDKPDITEFETVIRESDANIIWVSLGSPKQDYVASYLSTSLGKRVVAVGAAFDFYTSRKMEAPVSWQNVGLEWLYRLKTEPRRLWRRYLLGNSYFIFHLPLELIKNLVKD
jgi:N-acetylglucosaminyldiphosphoundecaprenol N-acetyl-beta-D-mannosaminyltransferase